MARIRRTLYEQRVAAARVLGYVVKLAADRRRWEWVQVGNDCGEVCIMAEGDERGYRTERAAWRAVFEAILCTEHEDDIEEAWRYANEPDEPSLWAFGEDASVPVAVVA